MSKMIRILLIVDNKFINKFVINLLKINAPRTSRSRGRLFSREARWFRYRCRVIIPYINRKRTETSKKHIKEGENKRKDTNVSGACRRRALSVQLVHCLLFFAVNKLCDYYFVFHFILVRTCGKRDKARGGGRETRPPLCRLGADASRAMLAGIEFSGKVHGDWLRRHSQLLVILHTHTDTHTDTHTHTHTLCVCVCVCVCV